MSTITIRLDSDTEKMLNSVCRRKAANKSEVVRDALKRQLSIQMFDQLRHEIMPYAGAQGYVVDEDVFKEVS
jgi:predicted transcriptional regulator